MVLAQPHLRRWTKAEYHQAAELGWFDRQRVELINGEIMEQRLRGEPHLRRWSKAEYYQAADLGWFHGQRVELIDGEVVQMAPQKDQHATAVTLVDYALRVIFAKGYVIRVQAPMNAAQKSEPEPDILVVRGTARSVDRHPTQALLIVEISETTLRYDRQRKSSLYASCGVLDYWIVNLLDRQLEIRRSPVADSRKEFGHDYADLSVYRPAEMISPLAKPRSKIKVADLLP